MKQIRALTKGHPPIKENSAATRASEDPGYFPEPTSPKQTPHTLATQRRNAKQKERNDFAANLPFVYHHKVVIYTRDVQIVNTEIGVVSIGVKRSSINRAKKKLAKLIFRGASKRRIARAERHLEFMTSKEQTRKEREAAKKKAEQ
jgi:hypothetical protein